MNLMRPLLSAAPLLVLALSAVPVHAQSAAPAGDSAAASGGDEATLGYPGAKPGAAGEENPGAYTHDGFYLRLAVGGGYAHDNLKYEGAGILGLLTVEGEAKGGSFQADIAAGWAVIPGLVIGGSLYIEQVANPSVTINGQSVSADVSVGTLTLFGPTIDWYPNPHKGFHFGGIIGGSQITVKDSTGKSQDNQPIGGGVVAFIGYEWWVGEEWALGVMGQFAAASMKDSDANIRHTWTSGGLAASVTYN